jgi:DNA-binding MarR family transcriptional regulator
LRAKSLLRIAIPRKNLEDRQQIYRLTIFRKSEKMKRTASLPAASVPTEGYRTLAEFRHVLRHFLAFSEAAARARGLTRRQHQAILAIRGYAEDDRRGVTVGVLAERLLIRHHSAVELVDRLVKAGLVRRVEAKDDRRRVNVLLTPKAEALLVDLSAAHLAELRRLRPGLIAVLEQLGEPETGEGEAGKSAPDQG